MPGSDMMSYGDVVAELGAGRSHLLLGNGFSIACDPIFSYPSLYAIAKKKGLNERIEKIFKKLGTNNFEGVMRLIGNLEWLADVYKLGSRAVHKEIKGDLEIVKKSLIEALADTHPAHTGRLPDEKKELCTKFLMPYHNIFTINYDLLLYWVELYALARLQGRDGFADDIDDSDADYCFFSEHLGDNKGIFFIHGALHLFCVDGEVRKHTWSKTSVPLISNIKVNLNAGQYPLFVAEGNSKQKLEQILNNGYLSYCLGKLERITNKLVVFGVSFGESDDHIADAIACGKVDTLYVGLCGGPKTANNRAIKRRLKLLEEKRKRFLDKKKRQAGLLEIKYFDATTASVWQ